MYRFIHIIFVAAALLMAGLHTASAQDNTYALNAKPFGVWLGEFQQEALASGIKPETIRAAFADILPDPKVIALDRKQPDDTMSFATYIRNTLPSTRIAEAKRLYKQHTVALAAAAKRYQVPAAYIVALWGKESSFGNYMGGFSTIRSLTTLAYEGRRAEFFRKELLAALRVLEKTGMTPEAVRGSWAGAMGQCQFMPSSYERYAADGDGDGRIDIWYNEADVFASIAHYLHTEGWKGDERWGRKVRIPQGFDNTLENIKVFRPLSEWKALGITDAQGSALPEADITAALVFGNRRNADEGAFLVYPNYNVLLHWNYSRYFATAVGLFADQLP